MAEEKDIKTLINSELPESEEEKVDLTGKKPIVKTIIVIMSIAICLYHLYTSGFGALSAMNQRAIHWLLVSIAVFFMFPSKKSKYYFLDAICLILAIVSGLYIIFTWGSVALTGAGAQTTLDIVLGCVAVLLCIEAARRTLGNVLPITALIFIAYLFIGPYLPAVIGHHGYSLRRIVTLLYFSTDGIYGTPIGVSSTFIVMFVIFGALLNKSGGGKFFIDFAFAIAGRLRGGAAKTAVISSALMGTVSGSPIANVVTTGTFTIPLMKKSGYRPEVAGAVEAVASTGGQIMPPIMGAAVFLMAEFTGIPYHEIVWAALIPAILYYFAIYLVVDIEAVKMGIKGLPSAELPSIKESLIKGWYLLTPVIPLVYLIMAGYSPTKSVFYSICLMVVVWLIANRRLMDFLRFVVEGFMGAVKSLAPVASACACAGIVVGIIQLTGIGLRLTSVIEIIAGNFFFVALVLTAIAALILGMGLPTTVLYIVLASLAAPALIKMGIPVLTAHLFVFYFGCISTITPPVALTSYAAAGIAEADPTKIGINAFKFGFAAYIIPFMMVYGPPLLLTGSAAEIAIAFVSACVGVFCLATCMQNWLLVKLQLIPRVILFICSLCLIKPGLYTDLAGLTGLAIVFAIQAIRRNKEKNSAVKLSV